MRDARLNVDQSTLRVTRRTIEAVASAYLPHGAINRQRLSRDELIALRKDAKNLRGRIASALAVHLNIKDVGPHSYPQPGVDHAMLDATSDYFAKLTHTLNRQIEKAETRTRRDNARKTERDEFWTQLLLLWCDFGGEPSGRAAASFLIAASKPVGSGASIQTVLRWLDRQKENVSKLTAEIRSIVGPRR